MLLIIVLLNYVILAKLILAKLASKNRIRALHNPKGIFIYENVPQSMVKVVFV